MNVNPIIYVDLDGVLADFDRLVLEKLGRTFDPMVGPGEDQEMWDCLMKIDNLYLQLEPTTYAKQLWAAVNGTGFRCQILTAIPRRTTLETAEADKREWVRRHIGEDVKVNIGPYSKDKWKHATPGDVLIDDRTDNIESWIEKGKGIGILHDYHRVDYTLHVLDELIDTINNHKSEELL